MSEPGISWDRADQIFPAIEARRAAWDAYRPAADSAFDRPEDGRARAAADSAWEAIREACGALIGRPPTSPTGLRAALAYLIEHEGDFMTDDTCELLTGLLKAPLPA